MKKEDIDNLRSALGTLPSQKPEKNYEYKNVFDDSVGYVKLIEFTSNPYKCLVRAACATWGDAKSGSTQKWEKLSPESRFVVALSALTGNTLPQALETVNFQFEYNGFARSCFDQAARTRIGASFQSIGSRDNNKLDSPFILYPDLYDDIQKDIELKKDFEEWIIKTKDLYEKILSKNKSSWQEARAVLPMSYSHSWVANYNLLSLKGQMGQRLKFCEESHIVYMFWKMRLEVENLFPLISNYLRPSCDYAKRCIYHGAHEGLTKYFSNLYAGCGRWKSENDSNYQEFNRSCSNSEEMSNYIKIIDNDKWINFTENDYDKLDSKDKKLFEEK